QLRFASYDHRDPRDGTRRSDVARLVESDAPRSLLWAYSRCYSRHHRVSTHCTLVSAFSALRAPLAVNRPDDLFFSHWRGDVGNFFRFNAAICIATGGPRPSYGFPPVRGTASRCDRLDHLLHSGVVDPSRHATVIHPLSPRHGRVLVRCVTFV